jgi:hypothetical protein
VHKRGRLERVPLPLIAELAVGELPQFRVDHRHQAVQCIFIAAGEILQDQRDGLRRHQTIVARPGRSARADSRSIFRARKIFSKIRIRPAHLISEG